MPANPPRPLSERIAELCPHRTHDSGLCCGGSDFRCACCIDCRKNKPKSTCKWEGHAIAGEVDRLHLQATTPAMFALEELSHWPKEAEGHPFVMMVTPPASFSLQPDKVLGIFEALHARMLEIAPESMKAMQAYYDIDGVRQKVAALTAKVSEGHARNCECRPAAPPCEEGQCVYPEWHHERTDPRCTEWRNRRG